MNDTLFVSIHCGLVTQYKHEKHSLKRVIGYVRQDRKQGKAVDPCWYESISYWVWSLRETRRQFRAARNLLRKGANK